MRKIPIQNETIAAVIIPLGDLRNFQTLFEFFLSANGGNILAIFDMELNEKTIKKILLMDSSGDKSTLKDLEPVPIHTQSSADYRLIVDNPSSLHRFTYFVPFLVIVLALICFVLNRHQKILINSKEQVTHNGLIQIQNIVEDFDPKVRKLHVYLKINGIRGKRVFEDMGSHEIHLLDKNNISTKYEVFHVYKEYIKPNYIETRWIPIFSTGVIDFTSVIIKIKLHKKHFNEDESIPITANVMFEIESDIASKIDISNRIVFTALLIYLFFVDACHNKFLNSTDQMLTLFLLLITILQFLPLHILQYYFPSTIYLFIDQFLKSVGIGYLIFYCIGILNYLSADNEIKYQYFGSIFWGAVGFGARFKEGLDICFSSSVQFFPKQDNQLFAIMKIIMFSLIFFIPFLVVALKSWSVVDTMQLQRVIMYTYVVSQFAFSFIFILILYALEVLKYNSLVMEEISQFMLVSFVVLMDYVHQKEGVDLAGYKSQNEIEIGGKFEIDTDETQMLPKGGNEHV